MQISKPQMAAIHGLLSDLGLMEEKMNFVRQYTSDREASIKLMTYAEANLLREFLFQEKDRRAKPMRNKILHYCGLMGMTDTKGGFDFQRISNFVKGIGSRNPKKKQLYKLTMKELREVTTQVEAIYLNESKRQAK